MKFRIVEKKKFSLSSGWDSNPRPSHDGRASLPLDHGSLSCAATANTDTNKSSCQLLAMVYFRKSIQDMFFFYELTNGQNHRLLSKTVNIYCAIFLKLNSTVHGSGFNALIKILTTSVTDFPNCVLLGVMEVKFHAHRASQRQRNGSFQFSASQWRRSTQRKQQSALYTACEAEKCNTGKQSELVNNSSAYQAVVFMADARMADFR